MTNAKPTYGEEYLRYQTGRSAFRKAVRQIYISRISKRVEGVATIDLGCGPGEILSRLPKGSIGIDVNPLAVDYCLAQGLNALTAEVGTVLEVFAEACTASQAKAVVCSHVLEHLNAPAEFARSLAAIGLQNGVERMVFVVPGERGFHSDPTHLFLVTEETLLGIDWGLLGLRVSEISYFPGPWRWIGRYFKYHELMVVLDKVPPRSVG